MSPIHILGCCIKATSRQNPVDSLRWHSEQDGQNKTVVAKVQSQIWNCCMNPSPTHVAVILIVLLDGICRSSHPGHLLTIYFGNPTVAR